MQVAIIENASIVNIAVFDDATFEDTCQQWSELVPQWELIPIGDLPEGAWIGWQRDEAGEWFDPNAPEPDPVPESEE